MNLKTEVKAPYKAKPEMPANKLAEYVFALPARRTALLRSLKYPDPDAYRAALYDPARTVLQKMLAYRTKEGISLGTLGRRLSSRLAEMNAAATQAFEDQLFARLQLQGLYFAPVPRTDTTSFSCRGVRVTMRPDLLLSRAGKTGDEVGALKLHFSKSLPLRIEAQQLVSSMLFCVYRDQLNDPSKIVKRALCLSVDVFAGTVIEAPVAYTERWRQIEAACAEISYLWPHI